jgi:hypothetical protein
MSVNPFSKASGISTQWQTAVAKATVQARASAQTPPAAANTTRAPSTDGFQEATKALTTWVSKFAAEATSLASRNPALKKDVANLVNDQRDLLASLKNVANQVNEHRNLLANDQIEKGGWKTYTPVLQQTSDINCGPAAAAMLARAKGGKEGVSDAELMNDLGSRYATQEGTTPQQLTQMLAHEGIAVKQGTAELDKGALDGTLTTGGKAVAMVDSNKIVPGGEAKPAGKAHWVLIDGMDDKGRYMVKDPGNASSYFVDPNTLANAVNSGREKHQAGGMLLVENARTPAPATVLAEEGTKKAEVLGNKPGTGSNTTRFGRESS